MVDANISVARLNKMYVSNSDNNKVINASIIPDGVSDHHMVTIEFNTAAPPHTKYYWHFNINILQDESFCGQLCRFWEIWQSNKESFDPMVGGGESTEKGFLSK